MVKEPIDVKLFSILACPKCRSDLKYNNSKTGLVCVRCGKEFEIREGIPVLMP